MIAVLLNGSLPNIKVTSFGKYSTMSRKVRKMAHTYCPKIGQDI